jgi:hypothetical protein
MPAGADSSATTIRAFAASGTLDAVAVFATAGTAAAASNTAASDPAKEKLLIGFSFDTYAPRAL